MTMRKAVEAKCFECIYDPLDTGTKHQQVEDCTSPNCPLYDYRPISGPTKQRLKQERYDAMSDKEKQAYDLKADEARERLAKAKGTH